MATPLAAWLNKSTGKRSLEESEKSSEEKEKKEIEKKECPLRFLPKWKEDFVWLRHDQQKNIMYCEICRNACFSSSKSNAHNEAPFVAGSQNFQKSTIIRYEKCKDHQDATKVKERREEIRVALDNSSAVSATALYAQMGACLLLATDDLPDTSFTTLVKSQELAGCDAYKKARPYRDHNIVASMQADLATICAQHTMQRIKNSAFLGIMVDESCDIAVQKKLVLYCKINHLGVAKVEFGVNTQVVNGKSDTVVAAILKFLDDNDIDIMKVTGLGTDGAPAMVGAENGVATQLKRRNPKIVTTWCVAHRLALVAYYAAQKIPYLNTIQRVLVDIYTYFQFSPVRYQKLRELKNIMQAQVKRFKKPTQVRWLSLQESVTAVLASWGVLVLALEHESTGTSVGAAQAKGILSQVKNSNSLQPCTLWPMLSLTSARAAECFSRMWWTLFMWKTC